ncbi:DUF1709-domain-containing protein [Aulographum hederae CBS 113979]|uniref:DUF1709-domain-containing protein n=1 Tax=Aulographum hederae CBS 113979 TaxID=1176131 RepID=A0A6G1H0B7_9PEZI|nr:DUF1709-domain-containing protein [Aulographum hederae CBS 113979]
MASPTKNGPLSEISPMAQRRNSPSYNQSTKKMLFHRESSPFGSSPYNKATSPRDFWKERDPTSPNRFSHSENHYEPEFSPSGQRRSSIEKLQKASRVKNSSMFAREQQNEYDPAAVPIIERPLAAGRPLSVQVNGNAYGGQGLEGMRKENPHFKGHRRGESQSKIPLLKPTGSSPQSSPSRSRPSPTRSSLSNNGRRSAQGFDADLGAWSEDDSGVRASTPRALRRHAKSVTFDSDPPQVNEYEMVTPDPSSVASGSREGSYESEDYDEEDMLSFDRGSSADHDDSFDASLEDTDKTPVVLPEDWRHMSPDNANTILANNFDDPFGPMHDYARSPSAGSDSGPRPLPALPSPAAHSRRDSVGLAAAAERTSGAQRSYHTPPPAATCTKEDIRNMRNSPMPLDERLRQLGLRDSPQAAAPMPQEKVVETTVTETEITTTTTEFVPHISREAILRKVKSQNLKELSQSTGEADYEGRGYGDYDDLDPDQPIPSREASSNFEVDVPEVAIKREDDEESEVDVYSIPEMYSPERSISRMDDYEDAREGSVLRHEIEKSPEDEASCYSPQSITEEQQGYSHSGTEDEGPPTPKPLEAVQEPVLPEKERSNSLPEALFDDDDFAVGLQSYMSETPPEQTEAAKPNLESVPEPLLRPATPEGRQSFQSDEMEQGTPDSVIRHPVDDGVEETEPQRESLYVPERVATIKSPTGLKARPSLTPADAATMAATRRNVSGEHAPPIPERNTSRPRSMEVESKPFVSSLVLDSVKLDLPLSADGGAFGLDEEFNRVIEAQKVQTLFPLSSKNRFPPYAAEHVTGSPFTPLPNTLVHSSTDTCFRTQKGYLMRQNTKVVVASSRQFSDEKAPLSPSASDASKRGTKSAGNSPRKVSDRSKTWVTEPWNGKPRRKSIRTASGEVRRKVAAGPVPPLPGQESAVSGMSALTEDQVVNSEDLEDGSERGRLFVKVVGVKELDLPLPQSERSTFQLTLDNGLHCVTTNHFSMARDANIGQEFELVVHNDLEFQLTLSTKLTPPPKPVAAAPSSPTKASPTKTKPKSGFSNFLMSPKKRKEQERKLAEEAERHARSVREEEAEKRRQLAAQQKARQAPPSAWELLHDLVSPSDGSFARAYISLKSHEKYCYGRPYLVDIPCFNEWAREEEGIANSVKSKRGGVVSRPPYKVAKLVLQLLYIPKPKDIADELMPKSINGALRALKEAEEASKRNHEGFMSQQGGDCPFWRRRFFRLQGVKLTAFHETTRQPRATINLSKASKLVDDRRCLLEDTTSKKGRRKSAFAEEEDGYMFVEDGFRIKFANGEVIDFYAESPDHKAGWMRVLSEAIGREDGLKKSWTDVVLARERSVGRAGNVAEDSSRKVSASKPPGHSRTKSTPAAAPPMVPARDASKPVPNDKSPRHQREGNATPRASARRGEVRSMMF